MLRIVFYHWHNINPNHGIAKCVCVCVCVCVWARARARVHEGVTKSFRTGRLERELQMVQLSATKCSCIAILWVSPMMFAAITICIASLQVFIIVYFVMTQSGNFWIHPYMLCSVVRIATRWTLPWTRHMARMSDTGNVYKILMGKPLSKFPLKNQKQ
jgi:hypothetical protein